MFKKTASCRSFHTLRKTSPENGQLSTSSILLAIHNVGGRHTLIGRTSFEGNIENSDLQIGGRGRLRVQVSRNYTAHAL